MPCNSGSALEIGLLWQTLHLRKVELEVELPSAGILGYVAILIRKGHAELDHFEKIHIAAKCLVMVVSRGAEVAYWKKNEQWSY